jgi:hypothetical protein
LGKGNFKFVQIKGKVLFKGVRLSQKFRNGVGPFKNPLKNYWARKIGINVKAF